MTNKFEITITVFIFFYLISFSSFAVQSQSELKKSKDTIATNSVREIKIRD
jgi:hypothetical protein